MVNTYPFDAALLKDGVHLFPAHIADDSWLLYHGTSFSCESAIEHEGLRGADKGLRKADIISVLEIFYRMQWAGINLDGFPVLSVFSMNDFGAAATKPIYLAETDVRALLYATTDRAGGEACMAMRNCFDDLNLFLTKEECRREFYDRPSDVEFTWVEDERGRRLARCFVEPQSREHVDLVWLRSALAELEPVRALCMDAIANHRYGLVYAIQFKPDQLDLVRVSSRASGGAGIEAIAIVPPSMLLGKVVVPASLTEPDWSWRIASDRRSGLRRLDSSSLLGRLWRRDRPQLFDAEGV